MKRYYDRMEKSSQKYRTERQDKALRSMLNLGYKKSAWLKKKSRCA